MAIWEAGVPVGGGGYTAGSSPTFSTVTATSGYVASSTSNTDFSAITLTNSGAGAAVQCSFQVRNGATSNDALAVGVNGTAYTTFQSWFQDGAFIVADANLTGGLSIVARNAAGDLRFYAGGSTSGDLMLQLTGDNKIGFYGTATPVARQTGVAVTAAAIHAALVSLNLITA